MQQVISKSQLKAKILEYLRNIEIEKQPLIVTHAGKPVVKIIPYKEEKLLDSMRNSVLHYQNPTEPVGKNNWELLK